jgi:hypothetical protein
MPRQAGLDVNNVQLPVTWADYHVSRPQGEFHGEIMPYLQPGMNRLQFFTSNARMGINATGVSFSARITLSP